MWLSILHIKLTKLDFFFFCVGRDNKITIQSQYVTNELLLTDLKSDSQWLKFHYQFLSERCLSVPGGWRPSLAPRWTENRSPAASSQDPFEPPWPKPQGHSMAPATIGIKCNPIMIWLVQGNQSGREDDVLVSVSICRLYLIYNTHHEHGYLSCRPQSYSEGDVLHWFAVSSQLVTLDGLVHASMHGHVRN